jgi:predicted nucleic acid-binding protein
MIFVDSNVFMYAAGAESKWRLPCQAFLSDIVSHARTRACTNAEVLQEILHRYTHLRMREKAIQIFDSIVALGIPIHPIRTEDLVCARMLFEEHPGLSSRDAVHLGVMQNHGISKIATYDQDFKQILWVETLEL